MQKTKASLKQQLYNTRCKHSDKDKEQQQDHDSCGEPILIRVELAYVSISGDRFNQDSGRI
jgi:hypothetical protein